MLVRLAEMGRIMRGLQDRPVFGLVNNAGWDEAKPFIQTELDLWKKVIDINLYGPLNLTHIVGRRMAERGAGRVVSIPSDAGRVGSSGEAVYSAAKGGIIAFMKTMGREFAKQGITFNTICAGPTDTPLLASVDATGGGRLVEALTRAIPMCRLAQPADYPGLADIKGYEYYGALANNIEKHGIDGFVNFLAELQIWGTPDQVYEKIMENQKRADAAGSICIFSYGGMPQELAKQNMQLFAEKVLPRLKAHDVGADIGGNGQAIQVAAE